MIVDYKEAINQVKENIRTLRNKYHYSQDKAQDLSGRAKVTISRIETGNTTPSLETILRIMHAYQVKSDVIFKDCFGKESESDDSEKQIMERLRCLPGPQRQKVYTLILAILDLMENPKEERDEKE